VSGAEFQTAEERSLGEQFLKDGHVILPVEDRRALDRIRDHAVSLACKRLGKEQPNDAKAFLDGMGAWLGPETVNEFRLAMIAGINAEPWVRPAYYRLARSALGTVVGSELAMQRRINLSIQLPDDESSVLPSHTDTWAGDSPFEVVLWVPLVDCHDSKAMFLLPPEPNTRATQRLAELDAKGVEGLFQLIEPELRYLAVPYGHFLLFDQNLIHGNRVNRERSTRWSFNCRFKGLFTPYADKKLGEFFEPITMKPATRLGLSYRLPDGFRE
jgi:sporadic carbohydrate cluster 2OG-Fe(II) oxygenase